MDFEIKDIMKWVVEDVTEKKPTDENVFIEGYEESLDAACKAADDIKKTCGSTETSVDEGSDMRTVVITVDFKLDNEENALEILGGISGDPLIWYITRSSTNSSGDKVGIATIFVKVWCADDVQ